MPTTVVREREGRLGEVEGLGIGLANDKLAQIDQRSGNGPTDLGFPTVRTEER